MKTFGALILGCIFNLLAHGLVSFLASPIHGFMVGSGIGGPLIAVVMAGAVIGYSGYLAAYLAARIVPGVSARGYTIVMAVLAFAGTLSWLSQAGMFDEGASAFLFLALGTSGAALGSAIGVQAGLQDGYGDGFTKVRKVSA